MEIKKKQPTFKSNGLYVDIVETGRNVLFFIPILLRSYSPKPTHLDTFHTTSSIVGLIITFSKAYTRHGRHQESQQHMLLFLLPFLTDINFLQAQLNIKNFEEMDDKVQHRFSLINCMAPLI